jgi:hypothetical protein
MSTYLRGFTERGIALDQATGHYYLERESPEGAAFLARHFEPVAENRWRPRPKGVTSKVVSVARSLASGRAASAETIARRKLSCFGGAATPPCPALERTERGAFCTKCACGRWQLANLAGAISSKLTFGWLECPLMRPGFSNEAAAP